MTAIPDEMRQNLLQISKALKDIDTSVQQVAGADLDIEKDLNKLGQAHHHLSLCYSLCGLFWIKLQLNGQDTKEHPVAKEMARLKIHMDRLQEIERSLEKRNLVIDKEASQRIIAHHSDLDKVRFLLQKKRKNMPVFSYLFQQVSFRNGYLFTWFCPLMVTPVYRRGLSSL